MQITGHITQVVPTQAGGYQGAGGYIFTYDMTIKGTDGQMYIGEIGSKKDMYPLGNGQQITVDVTKTDHGVRFKKTNPQYAQQPAQQPNQAGQQIMDRMHKQPAPDWDEIAKGKVRCNLVCAVLQSGVNPDLATLDAYMGYIFNGLQGGNPDDAPTEDSY